MKGDISRSTFDPRKHYDGVWMQQGRVQLDADWNEQQSINQYRMKTQGIDVIGQSGAPSFNPGFLIEVENGDLKIGKGRYYVDGILCENDDDIFYTSQPDLPLASLQNLASQFDSDQIDSALVYLDVWQRHITSLEDPYIKENALIGADTATRTKTVWQVRILPLAKSASGLQPVCGSDIPEWSDLIKPRIDPSTPDTNPTLNVRTMPPTSPGACILSPSAGYQRLENQLYRVEIHRGGLPGTATFKWSRDNGSVAVLIDQTQINAPTIKVRDTGPHSIFNFTDNPLVEVVDDVSELNLSQGQIMPLVKVGNADPSTHTITLETSVSIDNPVRPKLRRWDSPGEIPVTIPATNDGWIDLGEGGIQVKFSNGVYKEGDYWIIPARTATGEVEWPPYEIPNINPIAQPPLGIRHHYSKLAILRYKGKIAEPSSASSGDLAALSIDVLDCRKIFPPLTGASAIHITDISWRNDDVLGLDEVLNTGLVITLDGTPDPRSVSGSTMIVTVESHPELMAGANAAASLPDLIWVVNGIATVNGNQIVWKPVQQSGEAVDLRKQLETLLGSRDLIRMRIMLKGSSIWTVDARNQFLYLDGQAFGKPVDDAGAQKRINLVLPSGDGRRASDFEGWCYLKKAPETLKAIRIEFRSSDNTTGAANVTSPLPLPSPGGAVHFNNSFVLNNITIFFNWNIQDVNSTNIIIVHRPSVNTNVLVNVDGDFKVGDDGKSATFTSTGLANVGIYFITVFGTDDTAAGHTAVKAKDGTALDGGFTGNPGSDLNITFEVTEIVTCLAGSPGVPCTLGGPTNPCSEGQPNTPCTLGRADNPCPEGQPNTPCPNGRPDKPCQLGSGPFVICPQGSPSTPCPAGDPNRPCVQGKPDKPCTGPGLPNRPICPAVFKPHPE